MKYINNLPNGSPLSEVSNYGIYHKEITILEHISGSKQIDEHPKKFTDIPSDMALAISVNNGMALALIEDEHDFATVTDPNDTRPTVWIYIPMITVQQIFSK